MAANNEDEITLEIEDKLDNQDGIMLNDDAEELEVNLNEEIEPLDQKIKNEEFTEDYEIQEANLFLKTEESKKNEITPHSNKRKYSK